MELEEIAKGPGSIDDQWANFKVMLNRSWGIVLIVVVVAFVAGRRSAR